MLKPYGIIVQIDGNNNVRVCTYHRDGSIYVVDNVTQALEGLYSDNPNFLAVQTDPAEF